MKRISLTSPTNNTIKLIDKINNVLENHDVNEVKDALLTLITWWIADIPETEMTCSHDEFIDILAASLKEAVAYQKSVVESKTATRQ